VSAIDPCGECGCARDNHLERAGCVNCSCKKFREHTPEDFPSDNRLKIAALCGVLDFQLDSVRFEISRSAALPCGDTDELAGIRYYLDSAATTLEELRTIALARSRD
jgi:predicted  nucleic acid-binding Zn-ribbon protein